MLPKSSYVRYDSVPRRQDNESKKKGECLHVFYKVSKTPSKGYFHCLLGWVWLRPFYFLTYQVLDIPGLHLDGTPFQTRPRSSTGPGRGGVETRVGVPEVWVYGTSSFCRWSNLHRCYRRRGWRLKFRSPFLVCMESCRGCFRSSVEHPRLIQYFGGDSVNDIRS